VIGEHETKTCIVCGRIAVRWCELMSRLGATTSDPRALLKRIVEAHDLMLAMDATRFPAEEQARADAEYTRAIEDARAEVERAT